MLYQSHQYVAAAAICIANKQWARMTGQVGPCAHSATLHLICTLLHLSSFSYHSEGFQFKNLLWYIQITMTWKII